MNGEVIGIYVSAGGSKCSVIITDWLVCIADVSGLGHDGNVFWAVEFWWLFFFSLFFCNIGFLQTHKHQALHHSHLPDNGRSISRNVIKKQHDSRHDKLRQYEFY